jgi:hypothetical protein
MAPFPLFVILRFGREIKIIRFQALGWNYWCHFTLVLPAELSAAAVLIDFWDKNTNVNSAWVAICLVVVVLINFMGAGKSREISSPRRHN